jgi:carbamoyltransferase
VTTILGVAAYYHDAACCLLRDGVLVAAAEEERFTRVKYDPSTPLLAARYCLKEASLTLADVDCVAYYEDPVKKLGRQLWSGLPGVHPGMSIAERLDPGRPEHEIREALGFDGPIHVFEHHQSHAAAAFYFSGFEEAAVLTVDGVGEWSTATYGRGRGSTLEIFEEVHFPDSLGLLYSTITGYLGFGVNDGEYKVMGLAPYGRPRYVDEMRRLVRLLPEGQFELALEYFDFSRGDRMHSPELVELFGQPGRIAESPVDQFHKDVAHSLQVVLEEVLLAKVRYLHERMPVAGLCMAGGVALNCVANGRIAREGPFERLFVQPAANDAGSCLGAAALAHVQLTGERPSRARLEHVHLGPRFSREDVAQLLRGAGLAAHDFAGDEAQLLAAAAERLAHGRVVGWFQGRMEFGPRALGARSILADPRDSGMRDRINALVKKREAFRPFAPAVLASEAANHFDLDHPSPFMLETCQVRSALDLPAITHVDGSARVQTVDPSSQPRFAGLLAAFFARTGCPILLNTSFNMRDEPIVCTPEDALLCFIRSEIDCLVLGDFLLDRERVPDGWARRVREHWGEHAHGVAHDVYTFL